MSCVVQDHAVQESTQDGRHTQKTAWYTLGSSLMNGGNVKCECRCMNVIMTCTVLWMQCTAFTSLEFKIKQMQLKE